MVRMALVTLSANKNITFKNILLNNFFKMHIFFSFLWCKHATFVDLVWAWYGTSSTGPCMGFYGPCMGPVT